MKLFCKEKHWNVINGKLILFPKNDDQAKLLIRMEAAIEARVRLAVYEDICDLKLTDNRKAIVKAGVDNVALSVQALCAELALGDKNGNN